MYTTNKSHKGTRDGCLVNRLLQSKADGGGGSGVQVTLWHFCVQTLATEVSTKIKNYTGKMDEGNTQVEESTILLWTPFWRFSSGTPVSFRLKSTNTSRFVTKKERERARWEGGDRERGREGDRERGGGREGGRERGRKRTFGKLLYLNNRHQTNKDQT